MASQDFGEKMESRKNYGNLWHTDLVSTIQADLPYCCFSLWCGPCVSYLLRRRAIYNDMSRYQCCAGYMPCSGRCGESKCPEFCLCTEVFLCFGTSVASTRFLLQDEFNIQTTQCDNCIIGFMLSATNCMHILTCGDYCWEVCACMQTQHKIELDKRDGKFGPPGPMAVPPFQQMSRIEQPVPPPVGNPPPYPAYAQPYGYPPTPHGYPPAGYPPQNYYPK